MESRTLVLVVFLGVVCVAQALWCNHCKKIDKDYPYCDQIEERECASGHSKCIKITMQHPAYGEVRRCATEKECEARVPKEVIKQCCSDGDLCN